MKIQLALLMVSCLLLARTGLADPPEAAKKAPVDDAKVKAFLEAKKGTWRDMNVPESDGQLLFDTVVKNRYRNILEIGTSTGHSTIWLAWACSKNGGKVTTLELDERRHKEALGHFKEAGVADFVDARLGNAHDLVPELSGTFDLVFSDADKEWYKNYFLHAYPKLRVGGCFTAHNISMRRGEAIAEFMEYVKSVPHLETTVDTNGRGLSVSYKRASAPLPGVAEEIDKKVKALLEKKRGTWDDLNVPDSDGQLLHDLVVKGKYQDILEIGTSTGHSTTWLAWACSKTGGKVTTIEIREDRHQEALENLREAGLRHYVDARRADAHELVKKLEGPFDFVFSDADKEWYKQYFVDVYPRLKEGGCFTAHNVAMRRRGGGRGGRPGGRGGQGRGGAGGQGGQGGGIQEFLDHIQSLPDMLTTINTDSFAGVSISYKVKSGKKPGKEAE